MRIDLSIVRGIIRKSLEESRTEGCRTDVQRQRALYHALKAMYLLCKDQPRSVTVEITGTPKDSSLSDVVQVIFQPEYQAAMRALPGIVDQEASE